MFDSRFGGIRTNLFSNPAMEQPVGIVNLRTNLATTPLGQTFVSAQGTTLGWNNTRWFGSSGAGTHTNVTGATDGPLPTITAYVRKTWTTAQASGGGAADTGLQTNGWTGFTVNGIYTVSGWIRSSIARTLVGFDVTFSDATGVFQRTNLATGTLAAGVWQRFSATVTAPLSGATNTQFILDTDGAETIPVGTTVDVTGLLVERCVASSSSTILPSVAAVVTRTNLHPNPSLLRTTTGWSFAAAGGTWTATREVTMGSTTGGLPWGSASPWYKITNTVTNTTSPWGIYTNPNGTGGTPVIAGVPYSFAAYFVSSLDSTTTVRMNWTWYNSAGTQVGSTGASTFVANTPNVWQRLTATNQVAPAGAAFVMLAVFQSGTGVPVGTYMGVTSVQIEASTTLGGYFDGSTVGTASIDYAYQGTPFASASDQRTPAQGTLADYFDGSTRPPLRVNYLNNPRSGTATGWTQQLGTSEAATLTRITGAVDGPLLPDGTVATTYHRKTVTTLKTGSNSGIFVRDTATLGLAGATGDVVTASIYVRPSVAINYRCSITPRLAGSASGTASNGTAILCPANVWTRISHTLTTTAPYDTVQVWAVEDTAAFPPVGFTGDATAAMVERSATLGAYFDGATPAAAGIGATWSGTANASPSYLYDTDFTNSWTGTANASTSTINAPGIFGYGGVADRVAIQSSAWADTRTKSMRIIPGRTGPTNNDTFSDIRALLPAASAMAGRTYTVQGQIRLTAAQQGTLYTDARQFRAATDSPTQPNIVFAYTLQAPNAAGSYPVRATFTVPANATAWTFFRLYNGAVYGAGDVWWDSLLMEETTEQRIYFDGSYPNARWTGAADMSTSLGYGFVRLI